MILSTERQRIQHLLRRAGFGYSADELREYVALGLDGTIDRLLNPERVDDSAAEAAAAAFRGDALQRRDALLNLWHTRLVQTKRPLLEKLTYFWHDHVATGIHKVEGPSYMLVQNETIRAGALGKFRDLVLDMTRDPAMMIFLDNRVSVKKAPNENYARELMELFTLGEGVLYTERDVKEVARALTGWRLTTAKPNPDAAFSMATGVSFVAQQFDSGIKTVLGKSGNFGDAAVVGIITSKRECAEYIGTKLWRFFAVPDPTDAMIQRTTDAYFANDTSIREMLRVILLSPEMYSADAYRWRIKSPVEQVILPLRAFGLTERTSRIAYDTRVQGQVLFDPPSPAGWDWGQAWINSTSLLARANFANDITRRGRAGQWVDAAALLQANNATRTAEQAVDLVLDLIVGGDVDPGTRATLIEHIGGTHYNFAQASKSGALQGLFYLVLTMPLAQLA